MFCIYFTEQTQVQNFSEVQACDQDRFKRFFHHMLEHGVYWAPSAFESAFISQSHTQETTKKTLNAFQTFCQKESRNEL